METTIIGLSSLNIGPGAHGNSDNITIYIDNLILSESIIKLLSLIIDDALQW